MSLDAHDGTAAGMQAAPLANAFAASDVEEILRERGWLAPNANRAATDADARVEHFSAWLELAAALLGPHSSDRNSLAELLNLVFYYDAAASLATPDAQDVMARVGSREVIRELANLILDGAPIDSERFREIVEALKIATRYRSRELFHPIRLALAGRAGEGELDRVILLLDSAATLPFAVAVKGTRQRMLEFCAALE
ncbi:MAG: hypothetical protein WA734_19205 [Candidatus Acidiferrales bacterium]